VADLIEFRVTFGTRYATQLHPLFPAAHPDGWLAVLAETEDAARRLVHERIGSAWGFIYRPDFPGYPEAGRRFPRGKLAQWSTWNPIEVIDWPEQVARLQAQVAAVLAIHRPAPWPGGERDNPERTYCASCLDSDQRPIYYPCPTAQALGVSSG
jgi:hypothetical protein